MVKLNIYPHLPERALKLTDKNRKTLENGVSVQIDLEDRIRVSGYGEGQERLIRDFAKREKIMPPLWVWAHAFIENEEVRYFLDQDYICTSSAYKIKQREKRKFVDIGHQVMADQEYDVLSLEGGTFKIDKDNYGLVVPVPCGDYPMKRTESFEALIERFPKTAEALFLMDQEQLHRLLQLVPKIGYDQDEPEFFGELCSIPVDKDCSYSHLNFGGKVDLEEVRSPVSKKYARYLFGVWDTQFVPVTSRPMEISGGKIDKEQPPELKFNKQERYAFTYGGNRFEVYYYIGRDPLNPDLKDLEVVHLVKGFGVFDDGALFRSSYVPVSKEFAGLVSNQRRRVCSLDARNLRLLKKLPEHVRAVLKI